MIPLHEAFLRIFVALINTRKHTSLDEDFEHAKEYTDRMFEEVYPAGFKPGSVIEFEDLPSDTGSLSNKGRKIF